MDNNTLFTWGLSLISKSLKEDNNTINNYDCSYTELTDNIIKIKLSNYYEKLYFFAKLEHGNINNVFVALYNINNSFIDCVKI